MLNLKKLRIFVADDHQVITDGLSVLLESIGNCEIVGTASNGNDALHKVLLLQPDIVFMDINMPQLSGIESAKKILQKDQSIKIIFLSMYSEMSYILEAKKIGVKGYLLKNSGRKEIQAALLAIQQGNDYFGNELAEIFLHRLPNEQLLGDKVELTPREMEIVKLICLEKTMIEISTELGLSEHTTKTHRKNILKKLDLKNTAGLVRYAIENQLV